jgi:sulfatase maturation enzyme AslB (radical SAM superfamily)
MSNNFCRFLSNGYSIYNSGSILNVKPCCWYKGAGIQLNENFNKNIQERSKINNWTSGCQVCQKQEEYGQNSFRQSSFDIIPNIDSTAPVALDINLDMTCNAACVICDPGSSTYWSKQISSKTNTLYIKQDYDFTEHLEKILSTINLNELRRIKFFGGEPLLTDTHIKILEQVPNPSQCDIWYTSNASILPKKEVLTLWEKFKLVYFEASIDGTESQFEYIRWPLKWKKVEQNLLELKNTGPNNILFRINHTLNPFNIFYYDRLDNWVKEKLFTNKSGDPTEINVHPCWGTWGLERTPLRLREAIHKKYPDHLISKMISTLPVSDYNTILHFTDTWDIVRQHRWQDIFSEINEYFPV